MSETNNDLDEFMELATPDEGGSTPKRSRREPDMSPDDFDQPTGTLTQYSKNGQGLYPVPSTVASLPAGVYDIEFPNNIPTFIPHKIVTDNLLRMPDSKSDEVISEIEKFWTLKSRFKKFGFTHKRGFLLWGPPGSGKTSTIAFVVKQMVASGGLVLLGNTNPGILADMLKKMRQVEPERPAVVLLEDIDTLIQQYGESEVLSLLDGEASIDNVVYLATTNYPENLDGRIINRPSRFDRVVKIGMPTAEGRLAYLGSRNLELPATELDAWVEATEGFSIAHIKEVIVGVMCYGGTLESEVKRLKAMAKKPKSDSQETKVGFGA
jgi:AAA+ superfamily predicted ATPase